MTKYVSPARDTQRPRWPNESSESTKHDYVSAEWVIRPSLPDDESCLVSTWLKGYAHADEVRDRFPGASQDGSQDHIRFWRVYQPIVEALLRGAADVQVICDPARATYEPDSPAVIWAWACTSPDAVHWVCVKRSAAKAGLAADMVRDLLGDRVTRDQRTTFELVDMTRTVKVPKIWKRDRGWLNAMRTLSSRMLAGDSLTANVGGHVLDLRRREWRPGTERAA